MTLISLSSFTVSAAAQESCAVCDSGDSEEVATLMCTLALPCFENRERLVGSDLSPRELFQRDVAACDCLRSAKTSAPGMDAPLITVDLENTDLGKKLVHENYVNVLFSASTRFGDLEQISDYDFIGRDPSAPESAGQAATDIKALMVETDRCMPPRQFFAFRQLPAENRFYLHIPETFDSLDWNLLNLEQRLANATDEGVRSILRARYDFLVKNPLIRFLFSATAPADAPVGAGVQLDQRKRELFEIIRNLRPQDRNCGVTPGGCQLAVSRQSNGTQTALQRYDSLSKEFFRQEGVKGLIFDSIERFQAQSRNLGERTSLEQLPQNPVALRNLLTMVQPDHSNKSLDSCVGLDIEVDYCIQTFANYCELVSRAQTNTGESSRPGWLEQTLAGFTVQNKFNPEYLDFHNRICREPRRSPTGTEKTFEEFYLESCSGSAPAEFCGDQSRRLHQFLEAYPGEVGRTSMDVAAFSGFLNQIAPPVIEHEVVAEVLGQVRSGNASPGTTEGRARQARYEARRRNLRAAFQSTISEVPAGSSASAPRSANGSAPFPPTTQGSAASVPSVVTPFAPAFSPGPLPAWQTNEGPIQGETPVGEVIPKISAPVVPDSDLFANLTRQIADLNNQLSQQQDSVRRLGELEAPPAVNGDDRTLPEPGRLDPRPLAQAPISETPATPAISPGAQDTRGQVVRQPAAISGATDFTPEPSFGPVAFNPAAVAETALGRGSFNAALLEAQLGVGVEGEVPARGVIVVNDQNSIPSQLEAALRSAETQVLRITEEDLQILRSKDHANFGQLLERYAARVDFENSAAVPVVFTDGEQEVSYTLIRSGDRLVLYQNHSLQNLKNLFKQ